jgi:3-oxoacyl-[acyl-carrier protein] reductase
MPNSIEGKTSLITGAAGTMGLAVARAFLQEGATVVMADVAQKRLQEMASAFGEKVVSVVIDVTDPRAIERELERLRDSVGSVDILVNNAGILSKNKSQATTPEEWRRVVEINLNGMFYLSRAVIPGMQAKGWGRIVNVSSLAAQTGGLRRL